METLFGAKLRENARRPRAPAALARPDGDIPWPELVARVERCAEWLLREGCRAAEPVGLSVADEVGNLVASLALLDLGVPWVSLSTEEPAAIRQDLARRLAIRRVVADDARQALPGVAVSLLSHGLDRGTESPGRIAPLDVDADAPAFYASSSGTTGSPKIVTFTQRMMVWRATQVSDGQDFAPDERVMLPISVEQYPGKTVRLYTLLHGATVVVWNGSLAPFASLQELCVRMNVTTLQLTVLQARNLVVDSEGRPRLPPDVRVMISASRMPAGLPREFESRVGGRLFNRYGATEIGMISSMYPEGDDGTPDSVGRPVPELVLEIVDDDGTPVRRGIAGAIRMRWKAMACGYVGDPVATARHFADGWFYPHDVCALTEAGVLRFLGRRDDMMSLNGINIFPAEIERALEEHPAVRHAAAFPLKSSIFGDIPAAAVELNGTSRVDAPALVRYARERLGARAPRRIVIVDALPRNAAGKVVKRELATILAPRRGS